MFTIPKDPGLDTAPMVIVPELMIVPLLLIPALDEPLMAKVPLAFIVRLPPVFTETHLATAPAALMTGSLVTSGMVTLSLASGTPADQLLALVQAVPWLPSQVVCEEAVTAAASRKNMVRKR